MPTRIAKAVWEGGLREGQGRLSGEAGMQLAYSYQTRFDEGVHGSNPEELLAAAHAACFSMALSAALERNGTPSMIVETTGSCVLEKEGDRLSVTRMKLSTRAVVPGLDPAKFKELAEATKTGCIVSRALASVPMELEAKLE